MLTQYPISPNHGANGLVFTLRPAVHRFADIAAAYRHEGLAEPESLQDAWEQFKRIESEAYRQIESGLWD